MKIIDLIKQRGASLSFEFFPPKDEAGEAQLIRTAAKLEELGPTFVSVTYGAGGSTARNTRRMIERLLKETVLTPMPHLTCVNQDRDELRRILEGYRELGVENVLALRGDPPQGTGKFVVPKNGFCYGKDLVELAALVGGFSIGVAVYPEGHIEAPSREVDLQYTRQKIDAGADFAITQMFFDNRVFYDFRERAAKAGITVPLIPGILPITDLNKVRTFSQRCGTRLPEEVARRFEPAGSSASEMARIGLAVTTEQCADLIKNGVRYFHFYTLNRSDSVSQVIADLGLREMEHAH